MGVLEVRGSDASALLNPSSFSGRVREGNAQSVLVLDVPPEGLSGLAVGQCMFFGIVWESWGFLEAVATRLAWFLPSPGSARDLTDIHPISTLLDLKTLTPILAHTAKLVHREAMQPNPPSRISPTLDLSIFHPFDFGFPPPSSPSSVGVRRWDNQDLPSRHGLGDGAVTPPFTEYPAPKPHPLSLTFPLLPSPLKGRDNQDLPSRHGSGDGVVTPPFTEHPALSGSHLPSSSLSPLKGRNNQDLPSRHGSGDGVDTSLPVLNILSSLLVRIFHPLGLALPLPPSLSPQGR
ncbi:hypothetical protein D5F01_LYC25148 [Larimichthys crocea]|uniref:Uncharacterized protein n=1 Tax=Larimichthys crocea TaxID=215358 RepID=A0A6G0HCV8_LARCR|nr:hypothetical protein D5F01_LYC25148 [Larimichthys crocea]